MSRLTPFSSPLLLGFDSMEKTLERLAKSGDSYPPYNIERIQADENSRESLRITLAVAGFSESEAKRLFGRDPALPATTEQDYLTPWSAGKAAKRFLARFATLRV